ncbi:hypothetical protein SUGI_0462410 [Cryptomeria japonica]|nr:hypothetical protein SUGI_0462410 [Cryptomeria japonica]
MNKILQKLQRSFISSKVKRFEKLGYCNQPKICSGMEGVKFMRRSKREKDLGVVRGFLPVYVGEGGNMERFVIATHYLNHPLFVELLQSMGQEHGYHHQGGLTIPCEVVLFEHILKLVDDGKKVEYSSIATCMSPKIIPLHN